MRNFKIVIMCMIMAFMFASCSNVEDTSGTTVSETTIVSNTESAQANIDMYMKSYNDYSNSEAASFEAQKADIVIPNGESGKGVFRKSADGLYQNFTVEIEGNDSLKAFEYFKINDNDMFIAVSVLKNDGSVEPTIKYYAIGSEIHSMENEEFSVVSDPATIGLYTSFSQIEEIYG